MNEIDSILLAGVKERFGGNLAGECANVNHVILNKFKEYLDEDVTIHVGWIELNGNQYFKTEESDYPKYFNNKLRFNYHVWLEGANYFIDFTLIDTLRDMKEFDDSIIPGSYQYIGAEEAKELDIKYHTEHFGDDILEEFRIQKGAKTAKQKPNEEHLIGLRPYAFWLKKIPKGGPYPRGCFYFDKSKKSKRWTKNVWVEVLSPYHEEKYIGGRKNNRSRFLKYAGRIKGMLPNFPLDIIETWLWEHSDQIEEFFCYKLHLLRFSDSSFTLDELLPLSIEKNSPVFLNIRQLEDKDYQRNLQANKNWPMRRLSDYIFEKGTWPRKPIILSVKHCSETPIINGYKVLYPLHIIEGRKRLAVLIHLKDKKELRTRHKAWVGVIR